MAQHAIYRSDVFDLAGTIYKWQELFLSISEYDDLYKLKGHWYSHYPHDILQFGPARQYWTMRFEAMNQYFKRVAMHGNFRGTLYRLAFHWMVRTGLILKGSDGVWTEMTVTETGRENTITGARLSRCLVGRLSSA